MEKTGGSIPIPYEEIHGLLVNITGSSISSEAYLESLKKHIDYSVEKNGPYRRVFFTDFNLLQLDNQTLLKTIDYIKETNPCVERISTYSKSETIVQKSLKELQSLEKAGLTMVYHPVYSGNKEILTSIDKSETIENQLKAAKKIKKSGIGLTQILFLGISIAGKSHSHGEETANHVNAMSPDNISISHFQSIYKSWLKGDNELQFIPPDNIAIIEEMKTLLMNLHLKDCIFSSHNGTSFLTLKGRLPEKKNYLLTLLDEMKEHNLSEYLTCNLKEAL